MCKTDESNGVLKHMKWYHDLVDKEGRIPLRIDEKTILFIKPGQNILEVLEKYSDYPHALVGMGKGERAW